jgi:DNA-binding transcriptional MocR family regulator
MHLYERIYEDLKRSIDEGEIRPSERLPSIREVAARYGCNKLTAQRAFDLLSEAGAVENLVGSGSFVSYPAPPQERSGDFSAARLSEDFFPYEEAGRLLAEVLAAERGRVFSASPVRGEARLVFTLARRFSLPEESIVVTGGGLQGLDLCRRLFTGRGGKGREDPHILVEEPCFPAAISLFRPEASVTMEGDGPDPAGFEAFFAARKGGGSRLFYAVPDIHNPTGRRYSEAKKRAIAAIARAHDVWIVEDDYLSELEPSGIPRFVDLAPDRTIWIKSLSKTTAPGIRLGLISAPPALVGRAAALKAEVDTGPAAWLQFFTERILSSGLLDAELSACARVVASRRAELLALLARFPGLSCEAGTSGYNLWVRTDHEARLASPPWAEGRRFGFGPSLSRFFRLSFMALGEAEWPLAVRRLELILGAAFGAPLPPPGQPSQAASEPSVGGRS